MRPTKFILRFNWSHLFRTMTSETISNSSTSHIQRTAENSRHKMTSVATVVGIQDESKTVKSLSLKLHNEQITFKAGQWIDMFIPGVETVGGFSMSSSPLKLTQSQILDLAVKYSPHPPAHWIHTQCVEGSEVALRVGGDFFYDPVTTSDQDLLLVAGGVGINPLYSIINHVNDLNTKGDNFGQSAMQRVMLLYSAKTFDNLIFKSQLDVIQQTDKQIQCQYYVTREDMNTKSSSQLYGRRIELSDISKCLDWLRKDHVTAYLCGPSPMLTDIEKLLLDQGIPQYKVQYEKWW